MTSEMSTVGDTDNKVESRATATRQLPMTCESDGEHYRVNARTMELTSSNQVQSSSEVSEILDFFKWNQQCQRDVLALIQRHSDVASLVETMQKNNINCSMATKNFSPSHKNLKDSSQTKPQTEPLCIIQIKYRPFCKFKAPWKHACRGLTVHYRGGDIAMVSFSFNKFFNRHEFEKYMKISPNVFLRHQEERYGYKILLTVKEDGSNIKYFSDLKGILHAKTLGAAANDKVMNNVFQDSPTFSGLALKLLHVQFPQIEQKLLSEPGTAMICELKSKWNRVVTEYDFRGNKEGGSLAPLAWVGVDGSFRYAPLQKLCPDLFDTENRLPLHSKLTSSSSFDTDVKSFIHMLKHNPKTFGKMPEGIVVNIIDKKHDHFHPCMKIKDETYLSVHRDATIKIGSTQDLMFVQKRVLEETWDDEPQDFKSGGGGIREEHVVEFESQLKCMATQFSQVYQSLYENRESARDFASIVKTLPPSLSWVGPYLYKKRTRLYTTTDFEAYEFIRSALLAKKDRTHTNLESLQKNCGLRWWAI